MKLCSLASGSKGNSLFIETGGVRLLVDAGLSLKEITARLVQRQIEPESVHAVLVTHEHIDHIRSVGAFARRYGVPVITGYATGKAASKYLQQTDMIEFETGYSFEFRNIMIDPFPVTHDCCDPVGYVIESSEGRFGTATDLGIATRLVCEKLKGCVALNIESNHDPEMLLNGPYPWHLKQRIKSRHGHLSNSDSLELLKELAHDGLKALIMAHLSEVNNHPDKVVETTEQFLASQNRCSPQIVIGNQYQAGSLMIV